MKSVVGVLARALGALGAMLLVGTPAFADIREFNAAVVQRDFRTASIAAAETWPQLDKSSPGIAVIAREFSWVAMLAGQPAAAQVYARFLTEQGGSLPKPDATPAVSRVLFEWSALANAPSPEARVRLLLALQQRAAAPGRDLISVRAAQLLFRKAWEAEDWATAGKAADLALNVMQQIGGEYDLERFELRRGRIAASFMQARTTESYNAMYDLAEEIYGVVAAIDPADRERLSAVFFNTTAWGDVIYTTLKGDRKGMADRSGSVTRGRPSANDILFPAPGDAALPRCRIMTISSGRQPEFPNAGMAHGLAGVAVYAVTLSPGGRFGDAKLLGSAPHGHFEIAMDKALPTWRWQLDTRTPQGSCRMPSRQILTIQFLP